MTNNYSRRNTTYQEYSKWLFKQINLAQDAFILGQDINNKLALWNMFFLLMQLRNECHASAQPTSEQVQCMEEKLLCEGISTSVMQQIWPASYDDGDESIPSGGYDGIDFMQIQGDGTDHPIFRIRE